MHDVVEFTESDSQIWSREQEGGASGEATTTFLSRLDRSRMLMRAGQEVPLCLVRSVSVVVTRIPVSRVSACIPGILCIS